MINFGTAEASAIMGSGWLWFVYCKVSKNLEFRITNDQDLLSDQQSDLIPLFNLDIWEHAWYLDYNFAKGDYLKNIWKVVNWPKVERRLSSAKKM